MENVFEVVIKKLLEVGFYDLLLFVFSLALFYSILKRVKLFGDSPAIVAILAFSIAFIIFGYPVIVGFSMTLPLVKFFAQSFVWILVFFIGILMASFFYPDLPKMLTEKFTSRSMLYIGLTIGIVTVILSGLWNVLWMTPVVEGAVVPPSDVVFTATGVIIFCVLLIIASSIATRGTS